MNMFLYYSYDWFIDSLYVFIPAFLTAVITIPVIIKLCNKFKIGMDTPEDRKIHKKITPRMGGLSLIIAIIISLYFFSSFTADIETVYVTAFIVFLTGFIDDIYSIRGSYKIIVLIACALVMALFGGIHTKIFMILPLDIILTCFWVVGITSAFNAIDHMDGLSGGIAAIAVFFFYIISVQTNQYQWSILSISVFGALLGFLVFNFHPAKIFMGDGGSFLIGFLIAELSIEGEWSTNAVKASIVPMLILLIPIIDLTFVIIKRQILKETKTLKDVIDHSDADHIGHRLLDMGLSVRKSVLFIYYVCITIGLGAVVLRNTRPFEAVLILLIGLNISVIVTISAYFLKVKDKHR